MARKARSFCANVQMHPYKQLIVHIDFQRVDANTKLHMKVPMHFNAAAPLARLAQKAHQLERPLPPPRHLLPRRSNSRLAAHCTKGSPRWAFFSPIVWPNSKPLSNPRRYTAALPCPSNRQSEPNPFE
jgi:hypothetical protein